MTHNEHNPWAMTKEQLDRAAKGHREVMELPPKNPIVYRKPEGELVEHVSVNKAVPPQQDK